MNNIKIYGRYLLLMLVLASLTIYFHDATAGYTRNMSINIKGTVIGPNCIADALDVDFGEVALNTVAKGGGQTVNAAGVSSKKFTVNLTCKGGVSGNVQYQFIGALTAFNADALATSVPGLGIAISSSEGSRVVKVIPDAWYTFNSASGSHQMIASLVRDPTGTFAGGGFSATVILAIKVP